MKRGAHIIFIKDDTGNFFADIDIYGMMNLSKKFSIIEQFSPFLKTPDGEIHCFNCGWLFDGNAHCDCWKYDSGMEVDEAMSYT